MINKIKLHQNQDGSMSGKGNVSTLYHSIDISLEVNPNYKTDNDPVFYIKADNKNGHAIQLGAAWEKLINNGPNQGKKFLSLTLDDPSFNAPLYCTAFLTDEDLTYDVKVERKRQKAA